MSNLTAIVKSASISGSVAGVVSAAALAALSGSEGRGAVRPVNATSHWLHGDSAGRARDIDFEHTMVGYTTHHLSSVFWALLFEAIRPRPLDDLAGTARAACATAAVAGVVDYALVPRRVTPGWELVLPVRKIVLAYVALAAGLTIGGLLSSSQH